MSPSVSTGANIHAKHNYSYYFSGGSSMKHVCPTFSSNSVYRRLCIHKIFHAYNDLCLFMYILSCYDQRILECIYDI